MDQASRPSTFLAACAAVLAVGSLGWLAVHPADAQTDTTVASPTPAASSPSTPAPTAKDDLITVAKAAGNFTTFLKVVDAAGLTATLQGPGTFTVFAPTDTAFSKLPAGKLDDLLKPENKAKLVALVSYHLSNTKLTAADLAKTDEVKTIEGTPIDIDVTPDGKVVEVDDAKVLGSDLEASNGIIHSIDAVLQP